MLSFKTQEENAENVEFTYTLEEEESSVEVFDTTYKNGSENIMILKVKSKNELETQTYTFYLEKESDQAVVLDNTELTPLNISKQERIPYLAPCVIAGTSSIIFLLFYLLVIRYIQKMQRKYGFSDEMYIFEDMDEARQYAENEKKEEEQRETNRWRG